MGVDFNHCEICDTTIVNYNNGCRCVECDNVFCYDCLVGDFNTKPYSETHDDYTGEMLVEFCPYCSKTVISDKLRLETALKLLKLDLSELDKLIQKEN